MSKTMQFVALERLCFAGFYLTVNHRLFSRAKTRITATMISKKNTSRLNSFLQNAVLVFQRGISVILVVMALACWAKLMGLSGGGAGRFDLVHPDVRLVEALLAVIYPVAAAGLWFGVRWGFVLWLIGAIVQISAGGSYPQILGGPFMLIVGQVLLIGVFVIFQIYFIFIRRR